MVDCKRLILFYLSFLAGGVVVAVVTWLAIGSEPEASFTLVVTIPVVLLLLTAYFTRPGGADLTVTPQTDVFGVTARDRTSNLRADYGSGWALWLNRRAIPVGAALAGITLLVAAAVLYFAFGVQ